MPDFETDAIMDSDTVKITDLDPQSDSSRTSLSIVLLRLVRKTPFLANTRTKNTALALMICTIVLLFMVQPDVSSIQALGTSVATQSSSQLLASPDFIVHGSVPRQVIWIKISNGVETVLQAPAGIIVWHGCKLLNWHVPPKYTRPMIVICK